MVIGMHSSQVYTTLLVSLGSAQWLRADVLIDTEVDKAAATSTLTARQRVSATLINCRLL